jgi:hypothetical protein
MSDLKIVNISQGYIHKYENLKMKVLRLYCRHFVPLSWYNSLLTAGRQTVMVGVDYSWRNWYTSFRHIGTQLIHIIQTHCDATDTHHSDTLWRNWYTSFRHIGTQLIQFLDRGTQLMDVIISCEPVRQDLGTPPLVYWGDRGNRVRLPAKLSSPKDPGGCRADPTSYSVGTVPGALSLAG